MDVESYGDEPASSAMNLAASQNNNNITKIDSVRPAVRQMPFTSSSSNMPSEEHLITSRNSIWQQHTKHLHRLNTSPPGMTASNLSLVNSMPIMNCGPPPSQPPAMFSSESGATPTSSDQLNEYADRTVESPNRMAQENRHQTRIGDIQKSNSRDLKNGAETTHNNNCDNDNDEEVIVTNDDDDCPKKIPSKDLKRNDKNRYD